MVKSIVIWNISIRTIFLYIVLFFLFYSVVCLYVMLYFVLLWLFFISLNVLAPECSGDGDKMLTFLLVMMSLTDQEMSNKLINKALLDLERHRKTISSFFLQYYRKMAYTANLFIYLLYIDLQMVGGPEQIDIKLKRKHTKVTYTLLIQKPYIFYTQNSGMLLHFAKSCWSCSL